MNAYLKQVEFIRSTIENHFREYPQSAGILLMDGTGMLSSYQNTVLSLLGPEKLERFDEIHLISGSAYAYFIYTAIRENSFKWGPSDVPKWNRNVQGWHGIVPILSLAKFATSRFHQLPAGKPGGHHRACEEIFTEEFRNRPLSSFPKNLRIWAYNVQAKRMEFIGSQIEHSELTVADVISMAASVPAVFGEHRQNGVRYIDAMYAPRYSKLKYQVFEGKHVLHFNMFKTGSAKGIDSIKIHEHEDGNALVRKDFLRFIAGVRNAQFDQVTRYALFGDTHA